jgi:hypothetical protein
MYYPTNPHWARVVGYGPFSLWVIHKEGLCPSSGDINRPMMNHLFGFYDIRERKREVLFFYCVLDTNEIYT